MSQVSYSSISAAGLNREKLKKPYRNSYSLLSENAFVKSDLDNNNNNNNSKDTVYLSKTVNRLEQNMHFMENEHCHLLEGLQKQIDKLREENSDLQFQLIMRSDRTKDSSERNTNKTKDSNTISSITLSDKIIMLKQALDDEKRKNKELTDKLELLQKKSSQIDNIDEKSELLPINNGDNMIISPDIRVTLNPLVVSTYHQDTGLYLMKTPLTIQDCEMVIETLLKKIDSIHNTRDHSGSSRSLSGEQQLKIVPGIKKSLQPIKPISRGSTSLKLNQINESQYSKVFGIPSAQKLMPIIPQKPDDNKLEHGLRGVTGSRNSVRELKPPDNLSIFTEGKTGSSLPALPKSNDFNQAEKHRKLHLLQRKRLDQYNNRS